MGWTGAGASAQVSEVAKMLLEVLRDADAVAIGSIEGELQDTEETGTAWDGKGDKLKLSEHLVPVTVADPAFAVKLHENFNKLLSSEVWQFDGLPYGVNDPAEDDLLGSPAAISFEELFQQDCFISVCFINSGLCEDLVHGMEQMVSEGVHSAFTALSKLDEVIDVDICCTHRSLMRPVAGTWRWPMQLF